MLRWLLFGREEKEVNVTQQIREELAVASPNRSSIFKSYKAHTAEFNSVLLASPENVKLFVKALRQDEGLAFIGMLTDAVVESVVDCTKDEQQPFYFDESKDKQAIGFAFIRRIPRSYLIKA